MEKLTKIILRQIKHEKNVVSAAEKAEDKCRYMQGA